MRLKQKLNFVNFLLSIPSFNDDENEVENFEILSVAEEFNSYLEESETSSFNGLYLHTGSTGMYETNAVVYFAGYVGALIISKNNCDSCRAKFLKVPIEDIAILKQKGTFSCVNMSIRTRTILMLSGSADPLIILQILYLYNFKLSANNIKNIGLLKNC